MSKCLFCYQALKEDEIDFHPKCSKKIFGTVSPSFANKVLGKMAFASFNMGLKSL
jgi:serine/threonine-protein kinase HipA